MSLLSEIATVFDDISFPSKQTERRKKIGKFALSWKVIADVGSHPIIAAAYPVSVVAPVISLWKLLDVSDIYLKKLLSLMLVDVFTASLAAIVFHIIFIIIAPQTSRKWNSKRDLHSQIVAFCSKKGIQDDELVKITESYWKFITAEKPIFRLVLTMLLAFVVLQVAIIAAANAYATYRYLWDIAWIFPTATE